MDAMGDLCTYARRWSRILTTFRVRYDIKSSQISRRPARKDIAMEG